jgi:hypothetical protein
MRGREVGGRKSEVGDRLQPKATHKQHKTCSKINGTGRLGNLEDGKIPIILTKIF